MTEIDKIHRHLLSVAEESYPEIARVLRRHGPLFIPRRLSESLFIFLARTLINQQLPSGPANIIWNRLIKLAKEEKKPTRESFAKEYAAAICASGVTQEKAQALLALSDVFLDQQLGDEGLMREPDYDAVSQLVTGLWDFGQWSADMSAVFYLGMPDVWSSDDVALNRGMREIFVNNPPKHLDRIAEDFAPYRGYLALHVWRFLGEQQAVAS